MYGYYAERKQEYPTLQKSSRRYCANHRSGGGGEWEFKPPNTPIASPLTAAVMLEGEGCIGRKENLVSDRVYWVK